MSRLLTRTVSATLIAVFASLASAAALCLLPCELAPTIGASAPPSPEAHHCGEVPESSSNGLAVNGTSETCADQHAWDAPAADRTAPRVSAAALALNVVSTVSIRLSEQSGVVPASDATPPASPPLTFSPLRI
jgi:hypothetical protein